MITIGCPIQNKAHYLPIYLEHIRNIDYSKDDIQLAFLVNNSTDNTYDILKTFREEYLSEYYKISIWDISGVNNGYIDNRKGIRDYEAFATVRNMWLKMADSKSEWILSIDSDVLVPPNIIKQLMSHNKDMCSALVLNNRTNYNSYNILCLNNKGTQYNHITEGDYEFWEGLVPVDITGACVLMKRSSIEGIEYSGHPRGEDFSFCEELKDRGCEIFCDTTVKTVHLRP